MAVDTSEYKKEAPSNPPHGGKRETPPTIQLFSLSYFYLFSFD
jgi:hypothetical protein